MEYINIFIKSIFVDRTHTVRLMKQSAIMRTLLITLISVTTLVSCDKQEEPTPTPQEQEDPIFQGKWYMPNYGWLWGEDFHTIQPLLDAHGTYMQLLEQHPDTCCIIFKDVSGTQFDGQIEWRYPSYNPIMGDLFFNASYLYNIEDDGATLALYNPNGMFEKRITITKINNMEIMIDSVTYLRDKTNPTTMQPLPSGENWFYHTCDTQGVYYIGSSQFDYDNPIFEYRGSQLYVFYNPKVIDGIEGLYAVRPGLEYSTFPQNPHGCIDLFPYPTVMYSLQQIDYNGVELSAYVRVTGFNPKGVLKYAMDGCKEVTSLVLGKLDIEEYAFWGCPLKAIFLYNSDESTAHPSAFDDYTYKNTPLHIPVGTQSHLNAPWTNFKHIYDDLPDVQ